MQRLKETAPIIDRAQIMKRLAECCDLKALSPTVSILMELVNSDACPIEKIAKTIQQDQAVAIKVLKLANSVVFSRGDPVDSVYKAVLRIGTKQIRQVVMNLGVMERFSSSDASPLLNPTQYWEHSIACGLIAAAITRSRSKKESGVDAAFTMGLLHDIGRMVFMEALGDQYRGVLTLAHELRLPLEQVESRLLTVNHAEAMESVLLAWQFPKDLIKPIAMHHLPLAALRRHAESSFDDACTLALANRLAHALLLGSSGNDVIYPTDEFVQALQLSPEIIAKIERDIPVQTDEIKFAMLSRSSQEPWPSHRNQTRTKFPQMLQPIYISKTQEIDAFRIVLDQLRGAPGNDPAAPPNFAVVYVHESEEPAELLRELHKAETSAGVNALPLIVISSAGQLPFGDELRRNRPVLFLPTTIMTSTLLEAVGQLLSGVAGEIPNNINVVNRSK